MTGVIEASVVIPTLGRPRQLERCLASLTACHPRAAEVVIVDQSAGRETRVVAERYAAIGARVVESTGHGRGLAVNEGLRDARRELVLVTDDDCTVDPSWIGVAAARLADDPAVIVTGRVRPRGDPRNVPSTIEHLVRRDYTGEIHCRALYAGNMAANRSALLAFGGFDERVVPSSEDNDFCYRWLRAGRALVYEPELVVWHDDWRTPWELERLYVTYAEGQGVFYAKHLRQGDVYVLRFLLRDLAAGLRGWLAGTMRGTPRWLDSRQGILRGLPAGLVAGWRRFGPRQPRRDGNRR